MTEESERFQGDILPISSRDNNKNCTPETCMSILHKSALVTELSDVSPVELQSKDAATVAI